MLETTPGAAFLPVTVEYPVGRCLAPALERTKDSQWEDPMRILYSRPLTSPQRTCLPPDVRQIEDEANLSMVFAKRFPFLGRRSDLWAGLWLALRLWKSRRRFDAVVTGRYGEWFAVLQSVLPFGRRPHLLLDVEWLAVHTELWRIRLNRWLHRRIIQSATKTQVFCHVEAHNYARYFGVEESRFIWIPYCTDAPTAPTDVPAADYLFTSGTHQRDYVTLFEAVRDLPVELRVAAPRAAFAGMNIPANVHIAGTLSTHEYWRTLAGARFIVLSLRPDVIRRPGVITYVGALRMGKCVVVNDPEGASSYIDHQETGFLVEPASAAQLRRQICDLLQHPEIVERVAANAAQAARERFAAARYFCDIKQFLEDRLLHQ